MFLINSILIQHLKILFYLIHLYLKESYIDIVKPFHNHILTVLTTALPTEPITLEHLHKKLTLFARPEHYDKIVTSKDMV